MNNVTTKPHLAAAQAVLEQLKAAAIRDAKKRNLDLLWSVLVDMHQSGVRDYSLVLVGQRLEAAGGPKTQSLRNEGGKDFRDLIVAFVDALGPQGKPRQAAGRSQLDVAIDSLPDIGLRALLRQVVAENTLLKGQTDQLRSAFKNLNVASASPEQTVDSAGGAVVIQAAAELLTLAEKETLRRSVDKDRFAENGWKVRKNGSVVDDAGIVVLPPGFVPLLTRLSE